MATHETIWCPTMRPTREEFQRPFVQYVEEVFSQEPDLPMFKVIPPEGWRPRQSPFPDLEQIKIQTPIRQNVFGSKGSYRCVFIEEGELSGADFKQAAEVESRDAPGSQRKSRGDDTDGGDSQLERSFWSNITLKPPLYGADTPISFFDQELPFGWNLRNLGDLLRERQVPQVPGVTTPMTYFGMWRSFFGWHKEDADLLSINYLHFGAPKTWYCLSPKDQQKFERLASGLFPQLHKACRAFIRHKDIMLSPSLLRAHGISYMQARQAEGEFIVLNAAAYHSGFNLGFNCAEAVNFATPSWLQAGRRAQGCRCSKDVVHISMRLFDPALNDSDDGSTSGGEEQEDEKNGNSEQQNGKRKIEAGSDSHKQGRGTGSGSHAEKRARSGGSRDMDDKVLGQPFATVADDEQGNKFFCLVQKVDRPASTKGMVVLRWLKEDPDGLYRPVPTYWEERPDSLVTVRTQFLPEGLRKSAATRAAEAAGQTGQKHHLGAGWKLLTLRSRILDTEIIG